MGRPETAERQGRIELELMEERRRRFDESARRSRSPEIAEYRELRRRAVRARRVLPNP